MDLDPTLTNLYPMLADSANKSGDKKAAAEWAARNAEANPDSPEMNRRAPDLRVPQGAGKRN